MNLLVVSHTRGFGGLEQQVLSLGRGLTQRGHRVVLAVPRGSWLAEHCEAAGLPWEHVRFRGLGDPISHGKLLRLARRQRMDIIHGHARRSAFYSAVAARISRRRSVCTVHSMLTWKQFDLNERVIAVSHAVRDFLVGKGLPPQRIHVIYNGVSEPRASAPGQREAMRRRLGIEPSVLAVVMVGRMKIHKRHDLLLEALDRLGEPFSHVHAYFVGETTGSWYEALQRQIAERGLNGRVHFLGYREDVREVLTAMDVFALPSSHEALSIALLEAMSVGLAAVGSRAAGVPEVIEDGRTGLLFEPHDADALAERLRRLQQDSLRAELGANARQVCASKFSEQAMLSKTEALYESLLDRP